jgi:alkanesulfonate monooxygenase SsuD/methylene tetrahydromethanopterin reductase-like flavin-dependent oxidoreductase (luciferase family)
VDERAGSQPSAVAGSPAAVAERLLGFLELGFTALSLIPLGPGEREQAERLASEVVPALRAPKMGTSWRQHRDHPPM